MSSFISFIPSATPIVTTVALPPDRAARLQRCALLVDDEVSVRVVVRRFLERRGWAVLEAPSAEHALRLLNDDAVDVDVVLVDLHLPGLSGSALCQRISTAHPMLSARLLVASGDALKAVEELALESLHCPVLAKPFELDELGRTLDGLVAAA